MKARRLITRISFVMIVLLLVAPWTLVPQGRAQGQNLLSNGSFEQAHGDGMTLTAPPGWQVWSNVTSGLVGRQLQRGQEVVSNAGVYEGNGSFDAYKGWSAYSISLYQTVSGLQAGSTVRLAAFGRMWSCDSDAEQPTDPCITGDGNVVGETNTSASFRIGIDPTGGNDPNSGNIVWSTATSPYTGFQQMTVDAEAAGGSVTVVLSAGMQFPARHQHVFWDAASLSIVSGGTTSGDSGDGQTSAPAPAPPAIAAEVAPQLARDDGSIVHVVRPGDTLAAIAVAYDLDISQLLDLNGLTMATARILTPGQELIVQQADPNAAASSGGESSGEGTDGGEGEAGDGGSVEVAEGGQKPIENYDDAPVADASVPALPVDAMTTGSVCSSLFEDTNPNRLQESGEALLAGGQILLTMGGGSVDSYTTDGTSEPHCVDGLEPGDYLVLLTPPSGYGATTASTYALTVDIGEAVDVIFGAAPGFVPPQAPPAQGGVLFSDESGAETDTVSGPLDMLFNNSGIIVLALAGVVLVAGLGLTFLLRR